MLSSYSIWYLDLCAFCHLTNNKDFFILELCPKYLDFNTAKNQILQTESIGTVVILFANGLLFKFCDIAYTSDCDANLICLGQLYDNNI